VTVDDLIGNRTLDIAALRAEAAALTFSCTTVKDDKATRQFRARCVSMRTAIEAHCKRLRAPAKDFTDMVLAEQRRLTALVAEVEAIPDAVIKADEEATAAKKQAEAARLAAISVRIQTLADMPLRHVTSSSEVLSLLIADLETSDPADPPEQFAEFIEQAVAGRDKALTALRSMLEVAEEREAAALIARALSAQAEQQRIANEERAGQLAQLDAQQQAINAEADKQIQAATAAAETARKALATAEAALKRANEQAEAAAATAAAKLRETRAKAANEMYAALSAVFGDAGYDALTEPTKDTVTKALHAATFAATRATAAMEAANV
jgi:hypothetical protein